MSIPLPEAGEASLIELPRGHTLAIGGRRPLVMGVLNITPDSFSDGGRYLDAERAVEHALGMLRDGADLIDLGAESTRPGGGVYGSGAEEVTADEQLDRLLPVLQRLRTLTEVPLSVDTRSAAVGCEALAAGADLINDVSALGDGEMAAVVAAAGAAIILMHSRGDLRSMQKGIRFTDVVQEVRSELAQTVERAVAGGIPQDHILIDPGIGFGKTVKQNLELLAQIDSLRELGLPIVLGASRKSFIGAVTGRPSDERLGGSLAAAAWGASQGVQILRVHDVAETAQFLDLWSAFENNGKGRWG